MPLNAKKDDCFARSYQNNIRGLLTDLVCRASNQVAPTRVPYLTIYAAIMQNRDHLQLYTIFGSPRYNEFQLLFSQLNTSHTESCYPRLQ
jgi:hypothetical protein